MNLSDFGNWSQIASIVVPAVGTVWAVWRKMDRAQVEARFEMLRISDKLDFIEKQFGPNGGGIRQAVNELTDKMSKIEERQIGIGDKVAELSGKFTQHIIEQE
jgi:hypothetical protein